MSFIGDLLGEAKDTVSDVWGEVRDPLESMAALAGNLVLPGSSLLTSKLVSKGSQEQLNSGLGKFAQIGTSLYGSPVYNDVSKWITDGFTGGASIFDSTGFADTLSHVNVPQPWTQAGGLGGNFPGASSGDWFDWRKWGKQLLNPSSLMSVGSGLYGMNEAQKMEALASRVGAQASPWDTSGGRGLAGTQLQDLMRDPTQLAQNDPAYQLRIQAAQRAMAPMGQGSGAMAVAAANASSDWLDQRMNQLGQLAGAQFSPASGGELTLKGTEAANDIRSRSLASIGYGITPNSNNATLDALRRMLSQGGA